MLFVCFQLGNTHPALIDHAGVIWYSKLTIKNEYK